MAIQIKKFFLEIVDNNFTKDHLYCKVFNRKTLKESYPCIPNMKHLIIAHNQKVLNTQNKKSRMCDCTKQDCPINENCLIENVL